MFAKRNSITLAALWLILLIIGVFWYINDTRSLVAMMKDQVELSSALKESQKEIKRLVTIEKKHSELNDRWLISEKKIISADEPAFSLSYINWIMSRNNLPIDFDFTLNSKRKEKSHTTFVYTLNGEGSYNNIMKLIWYLTYEPILYQINSISLRRTSKGQDFLIFNIKLRGYSVENELELDGYSELTPTLQTNIESHHDIFNPLIKPQPKIVKREVVKRTLPPKKPGEVNVEKATLKVVTNNSIFITDGGGLKELKVGDAVYLGKLIGINQGTNEATFVITKFGRSQSITIALDYRK
jgi:hypothetical protein